jgi:hypothetical protein
VGLQRLLPRGGEGEQGEGHGHRERHRDQQEESTVDSHCVAPSPRPRINSRRHTVTWWACQAGGGMYLATATAGEPQERRAELGHG